MRVRTFWATLGLCGVLGAGLASPASADCEGGFTEEYVGNVSRTFSSGSSWSVEVYRRNCEGLVLHSLTYKPAGGQPMMVLSQANIGGFHVPYLSGSPR